MMELRRGLYTNLKRVMFLYMLGRITHCVERLDDHHHIVSPVEHKGNTMMENKVEIGSPGRDRTYDKSVNSRLLYR